jgi:hypothetical protein
MSEDSSGGRGPKEPPWVKIVTQIIASVGLIIAAYIAVPKGGSEDKKPSVVVIAQSVLQPQVRPSEVLQAPSTSPTVPAPQPQVVPPTEGSEAKATVAGDATFSPCKAQPGIFGLGAGNCSETTAVRANVCVAVPAGAVIDEVRLFTKFADDPAPIDTLAPVKPGTDTGWSRFEGGLIDTPSAGPRSVCWAFAHWSSHQTRLARISVAYHVPKRP